MRGTFDDKPENFIIFQKVVMAAIAKGWKVECLLGDFPEHYKDFYFEDGKLIVIALDKTEWEFSFRDIIYRHDFAKILFGEEWFCEYCNEYVPDDCPHTPIQAWKHELRELVISEDPLKEIDGFLFLNDQESKKE